MRRGRGEQQCVAIGLGVLDVDRADRACGAGLLSIITFWPELPSISVALADDVGRSGRRERDDEPDRSFGILALGTNDSRRGDSAQAGSQ
jgi:hypothetical protein